MSEDEKADLQQAEEICPRFLACDLEVEQEVGAKDLLAGILRKSEGVVDEGSEDLEYL